MGGKEPPGGVAVEPADHGLGRSRGGLTIKLHPAVEQRQKPMSIVITAGQRGDSPRFEVALGRVRVSRLGPGRPATGQGGSVPKGVRASRTNRAYQPVAVTSTFDTRPTPVSNDHGIER
jgi:hypothetical protein